MPLCGRIVQEANPYERIRRIVEDAGPYVGFCGGTKAPPYEKIGWIVREAKRMQRLLLEEKLAPKVTDEVLDAEHPSPFPDDTSSDLAYARTTFPSRGRLFS